MAAIFKIGNSKDIPDIPDHLSSEAKSFLKLCLQRDPAARPTAAQLIEHSWVKDQASVRSSRSGSGITRDMFSTSTDGSKATVRLQSMTMHCQTVGYIMKSAYACAMYDDQLWLDDIISHICWPQY